MPVSSKEKLQFRCKNEPGYGSGEYTVPEDHVRKFLGDDNYKVNKEKLKAKLGILLKSFIANRNNPRKMQVIMKEIRKIKQQLQK